MTTVMVIAMMISTTMMIVTNTLAIMRAYTLRTKRHVQCHTHKHKNMQDQLLKMQICFCLPMSTYAHAIFPLMFLRTRLASYAILPRR